MNEESKHEKKTRQRGVLCIMGAGEDGEQTKVCDNLTDETLPDAVSKLPVGKYILRRYYDRPLVKQEIKRNQVKIG
jgi:hypothetical protein